MAFNQSQVSAVDHFLGPMLVLAGPGSGKTTVITHRTKKLIEEYGVNPTNILVITFTKAAAQQMQERFYSLMGGKKSSVTFGTFHAVYFKILKYAYNYSATNILREDMKYDILREIISYLKMDISDEKDFISDIISEISLVKGDMMDVDHYYSKNCSESYFKKIYSMYNDRLIRSNLIDFDDMLVMCYELLTKRTDILKLWQDKYKFILIDEFQDISKVQYEIIKLLALPENNLFIVGDDDQSIYRFRGAKPEIMLNFKKDYPKTLEILLDVNYRSTGAIVKNSIALINHNKVRFIKKIKHCHEEGDGLSIMEFENQLEESKRIIKIISDSIKNGEEYKDTAVLYRTNTNPRILVEKLIEYNIPFRIKDSIPNIYEHFLAKNIISYIKIAMGNDSRKEYLSIINKPKRYISRDAFNTPLVNLEDIKEYYEDKDYVVERIDRLEYDIMMLEKMTPYAAICYIRRGIGYDEYVKEYAEYRRINIEELIEVLDELEEGARGYKTYDEWFLHIKEYTKELKHQVNIRNEITNAIELETMHSSKGLEYNNVIILGANEGITPHKKAVLDGDIEEERRLFYVAMTRAKKRLYITYTSERYGKKTKQSRFIKDILGEENIDEHKNK
jgi:DNA helicase II / ATP-dependent DNA helicase PcrA